MNIGKVQREDKTAWAQMRYRLWPTTNLEIHREEIDGFFEGESRDISDAFVMEKEGTIIGFIEINIRNFAEGSDADSVPYVEGWFIEEEFRGQGLGSSLMSFVEFWARAEGFTELASDTTLENTGSISLHKRLGFKEQERVVCFLKRFD